MVECDQVESFQDFSKSTDVVFHSPAGGEFWHLRTILNFGSQSKDYLWISLHNDRKKLQILIQGDPFNEAFKLNNIVCGEPHASKENV